MLKEVQEALAEAKKKTGETQAAIAELARLRGVLAREKGEFRQLNDDVNVKLEGLEQLEDTFQMQEARLRREERILEGELLLSPVARDLMAEAGFMEAPGSEAFFKEDQQAVLKEEVVRQPVQHRGRERIFSPLREGWRSRWSRNKDNVAEGEVMVLPWRERIQERWTSVEMPDGKEIKNSDFLPHFVKADGYYENGDVVGRQAVYYLPSDLYQFFQKSHL